MREIKFKAFLKKEKKIVNVDKINFDTKEIVHYENKDLPFPTVTRYSFEDIELMQFTGLYDKNGKEIYEGDIVKINTDYQELIGVIKFGIKEYTLSVSYYCDFHIDFIDKNIECGIYFWIKNYGIEVIGNIYENEDLLKRKLKKRF